MIIVKTWSLLGALQRPTQVRKTMLLVEGGCVVSISHSSFLLIHEPLAPALRLRASDWRISTWR